VSPAVVAVLVVVVCRGGVGGGGIVNAKKARVPGTGTRYLVKKIVFWAVPGTRTCRAADYGESITVPLFHSISPDGFFFRKFASVFRFCNEGMSILIR
jgi:hypothetical protein